MSHLISIATSSSRSWMYSTPQSLTATSPGLATMTAIFDFCVTEQGELLSTEALQHGLMLNMSASLQQVIFLCRRYCSILMRTLLAVEESQVCLSLSLVGEQSLRYKLTYQRKADETHNETRRTCLTAVDAASCCSTIKVSTLLMKFERSNFPTSDCLESYVPWGLHWNSFSNFLL